MSATLRVLEVFDSLQGEGVWSGVPMTFVRLAGCNAPEAGLACTAWCDTPNSWDAAAGELRAVTDLAAAVRLPRVCVTGGEPLLQLEGVTALGRLLRARGVAVHLETNGTLPPPPTDSVDWITVSPKPPRYEVAAELTGQVSELKVVVDRGFLNDPKRAVARIEALAKAHPSAAVCLQPEASLGRASVDAAVASVTAQPRWRLSLQLHKVLGLP